MMRAIPGWFGGKALLYLLPALAIVAAALARTIAATPIW